MPRSSRSSKSWNKIIDSYESSGMSKTKFCQSKNIPRPQFLYWCNKLRPNLKSQTHVKRAYSVSGTPFLPVIRTTQAHFSITLGNGVKVSFDSAPEPKWLAELISSFGSSHDFN